MNGYTARRQLIGVYQLSAGSIGLGATITRSPLLVGELPPAVRTEAVILFTCAAFTFGLIAWAGVLLLRPRPAGFLLSMIAQLAQVVSWSSATTKYSLIAGFYVGARWTAAGVDPVAGATASFQLAWSGPIADAFVVINCVPFLVIWLLLTPSGGRLSLAGRDLGAPTERARLSP